MKKIAVSIAFLLVLVLSSCSSTSSATTQKSMADTLVGTYVGKNGSVLTLLPDGKSEYYYMLSNVTYSTAGNWSCDDKTLTWHFNNTPITASLNNLSSSSFTLDSANGWTREQFTKVSDIAEYKSTTKCREILRQSLNRPEMDNFDASLNTTCTVGNVTFSIPFYWQKDGDCYIAENYSSDDSLASLTFIEDTSVSSGIANEVFLSKIDSILNERIDGIIKESGGQVLQPSSKLYIKDFVGAQASAQMNYDDSAASIRFIVTAINNPSNASLIWVILAYSSSTIFKYDSDYNKIINSITPVSTVSTENSIPGGGRTDTSSSSNLPDANNADGVTPELKDFLDSYEAYMDQYILFMQNYENSDNPYAMLSDYLTMMQRYSEFSDALSNYDTDNMSAADSAYYFEVTMRVTQKLLAAAQ